MHLYVWEEDLNKYMHRVEKEEHHVMHKYKYITNNIKVTIWKIIILICIGMQKLYNIKLIKYVQFV